MFSFEEPSCLELSISLILMREMRDGDTESWYAGDCKGIAQSIMAVTKGKAVPVEIIADGPSNDILEGIHFYCYYENVSFMYVGEEYSEEYKNLRERAPYLEPASLPKDYFGMEILYCTSLIRQGEYRHESEITYTYEDFDKWYEEKQNDR